jgi:hypothetical protein
MYNSYFFRHNTNTNRHPFKLPTNFTAPIPDNIITITFKNTFQTFTKTSKQNMKNTKNMQNQIYLKMNYKLSIILKLIMI